MYDYYLGGKDNYPVDREAARRVLRAAPEVREIARANRAFLRRAVRFLAGEAGIRQLIDIGTGIPSAGNVHEVAGEVAPGTRVVYVDNDPIVHVHANALLAGSGTTRIVLADLRQPEAILTHPKTRELIDFTQPVALLLVAILHFITDAENQAALTATLREALPPGSAVPWDQRFPHRNGRKSGRRLRPGHLTGHAAQPRADRRAVRRLAPRRARPRPSPAMAPGRPPAPPGRPAQDVDLRRRRPPPRLTPPGRKTRPCPRRPQHRRAAAVPPVHGQAGVAVHDGPRVLIATDCLSEGINLQDGFTAVLHYDLAWNPTRHEQREGRVDRFGQVAPTVRTVTYYGADNKIDGVVLDVLIRRHEAIKRSTGVSVPVPVDSATVMNAIWESLLLLGADPEQMTLDLGALTTSEIAYAVLTQWVDAAEREKASRSRFRQATLRPDEVEATLNEVRRSLGGPADAERFMRGALGLLSGQISDTADGFTVRTDTLPRAVLDQLPVTKTSELRFHRSLPAPVGEPLLTRTDSTVEATARYVLDAALDPLLPSVVRPARRAAVIRTTAVHTVTTLLVVRFRIELVVPGSRRTITQVAEDAQFLAFTSSGDQLTWLNSAETDALLTARPTGNVHDELAAAQLQRALHRLPALQEHLTAIGSSVAADAVEAHRAVRRTSRIGLRGIDARPLPPPDVLGVYIYLPGQGRS